MPGLWAAVPLTLSEEELTEETINKKTSSTWQFGSCQKKKKKKQFLLKRKN